MPTIMTEEQMETDRVQLSVDLLAGSIYIYSFYASNLGILRQTHAMLDVDSASSPVSIRTVP